MPAYGLQNEEYLPGLEFNELKISTVDDFRYFCQNFVRFCEVLVRSGSIRKLVLVTANDDGAPLQEIAEKFEELKQSLLEVDLELDVKLNPKLHDREIRIDNGWIIKIDRGLDFYQKPASWFEVGAHDLALRKCLETKVDIYRPD